MKVALTTLIANRAIKRMIQKKKLKDRFAGLANQRSIRKNYSTRSHRPSAGYYRLRGLLYFDQTPSAVSGDRKCGVVTKARDIDPSSFTSLQKGC